MTAPAYTVTPDRLGGDVLLDMLERNVHHIPVLSAAGQVLGVVDDGDLVAADARKPLLLRRAIALAESPAELATAAAGLNPVIIALHDARVTAEQVTAVRSVVLDALTRRLVELAVRDAGTPPVPFTWFALGSLARREAAPSSDVDSALAWDGTVQSDAAGYFRRVTRAVDEGLRACGISPDEHGASAANPIFARSLASWRRAARSLSEDPTQDKALILVSVLADSRPVWSSGGATGGRPVGARQPDAGAAAAAGPVRAVVPAAHRVPARLRGRALGRAARAARPQARGDDPDRRPGPVGRDGGRGGGRLDAGAAAGGRGGRDDGQRGGADADGGVRPHLLAPPRPPGRAAAAWLGRRTTSSTPRR